MKVNHKKVSMISGYPFLSSPNSVGIYLIPKTNHASFNSILKIVMIVIFIGNNQGDLNMELTESATRNTFSTFMSIINSSKKPKNYPECWCSWLNLAGLFWSCKCKNQNEKFSKKIQTKLFLSYSDWFIVRETFFPKVGNYAFYKKFSKWWLSKRKCFRKKLLLTYSCKIIWRKSCVFMKIPQCKYWTIIWEPNSRLSSSKKSEIKSSDSTLYQNIFNMRSEWGQS